MTTDEAVNMLLEARDHIVDLDDELTLYKGMYEAERDCYEAERDRHRWTRDNMASLRDLEQDHYELQEKYAKLCDAYDVDTEDLKKRLAHSIAAHKETAAALERAQRETTTCHQSAKRAWERVHALEDVS